MTVDDDPVLIDTDAATEALRMEPATLERMGGLPAAHPVPCRRQRRALWNLHDLRRQLAAYLDERSGE